MVAFSHLPRSVTDIALQVTYLNSVVMPDEPSSGEDASNDDDDDADENDADGADKSS